MLVADNSVRYLQGHSIQFNTLVSVDLLLASLTVWKYGLIIVIFLFQIAKLEQQVRESGEKLRNAELQMKDKQQHMEKLVSSYRMI